MNIELKVYILCAKILFLKLLEEEVVVMTIIIISSSSNIANRLLFIFPIKNNTHDVGYVN